MTKENQIAQDSIRITQRQAQILGFLFRMPTDVTHETITKLALQDSVFCDRIMGIIFPKRRPPSISPPLIHQCIKQLDKLIDVIQVGNFVGEEGVGRELVLVKVQANSDTRAEVTQICDVFRGKIIDVASTSLIVEVTGNENKIEAFLSLIESFGISELARTGTVSLRRGMLDD